MSRSSCSPLGSSVSSLMSDEVPKRCAHSLSAGLPLSRYLKSYSCCEQMSRNRVENLLRAPGTLDAVPPSRCQKENTYEVRLAEGWLPDREMNSGM